MISLNENFKESLIIIRFPITEVAAMAIITSLSGSIPEVSILRTTYFLALNLKESVYFFQNSG